MIIWPFSFQDFFSAGHNYIWKTKPTILKPDHGSQKGWSWFGCQTGQHRVLGSPVLGRKVPWPLFWGGKNFNCFQSGGNVPREDLQPCDIFQSDVVHLRSKCSSLWLHVSYDQAHWLIKLVFLADWLKHWNITHCDTLTTAISHDAEENLILQ